jgi:hypothetical protein
MYWLPYGHVYDPQRDTVMCLQHDFAQPRDSSPAAAPFWQALLLARPAALDPTQPQLVIFHTFPSLHSVSMLILRFERESLNEERDLLLQ